MDQRGAIAATRHGQPHLQPLVGRRHRRRLQHLAAQRQRPALEDRVSQAEREPHTHATDRQRQRRDTAAQRLWCNCLCWRSGWRRWWRGQSLHLCPRPTPAGDELRLDRFHLRRTSGRTLRFGWRRVALALLQSMQPHPCAQTRRHPAQPQPRLGEGQNHGDKHASTEQRISKCRVAASPAPPQREKCERGQRARVTRCRLRRRNGEKADGDQRVQGKEDGERARHAVLPDSHPQNPEEKQSGPQGCRTVFRVFCSRGL